METRCYPQWPVLDLARSPTDRAARIRVLFSLRRSSSFKMGAHRNAAEKNVSAIAEVRTQRGDQNLLRFMTRRILLSFLLASTFSLAHAGILQRGKVQLICHRTANRDMPENTLEALAYAARMGCNVVELDIRRTLDGRLVLAHDGYLERLTGGIGDIEQTSSDELELLDTGAWMGQRFEHMHIPSFDDALEVA